MTRRICPAIMLAILMFSSAVWADFVTSAVEYQYPSPYTPPANTGSYEFDVNQFNPSLGTLQKVIIDWKGSYGGWFSVKNTDTSTASLVQGNQSVTITASTNSFADTLFSFGGSSGTQSWSNVLSGVTEYYPATRPASGIWSGDTGAAQETDVTSDLSVWQGVGTNPVDMFLSGGTNTSGSSTTNLSSSSHGYGGLDFTVQYDYTNNITPEPCTLGMMALGLAGIGVLRKRRRK
jgi:hypothetical protein